ncbi:hypothetical protein [Streptomyces sp. NPDC001307]|uniref:hypothetical protein n=1 Tax=Streptomyces sp. NPDC001307 TaxID=3364560 RepID=UPI00368D707D
MNEMETLVSELKAAHADGKDAIELALLARDKLGAGFRAVPFIASFRLAFDIPLTVLQRAQAWERFGLGSVHISDEAFTSLLSPWLTMREEGPAGGVVGVGGGDSRALLNLGPSGDRRTRGVRRSFAYGLGVVVHPVGPH